jgi:hypothetical protein
VLQLKPLNTATMMAAEIISGVSLEGKVAVSVCNGSSGDKRPCQRPTPSGQGNFGLTRKEDAMEYATPGNTGLLVSKLCFGTMTIPD